MLLKSVEEVSQDKIQEQEERKEIDKLLSKNQQVIDCITRIIKDGERRRTEIIKLAHEELKEERISKDRIKKVLDTHDGFNFEKGKRWKSKTADKNAQIYTLLQSTAVDFMQYDQAS